MMFTGCLEGIEWSFNVIFLGGIKGVSLVLAGCFKSYLFQTCNYLQTNSFLSLLLCVS